jgi:hypothetical protein
MARAKKAQRTNYKRLLDEERASSFGLQMRLQEVERDLEGEMAISKRLRGELDQSQRKLYRAVTRLHAAGEQFAGMGNLSSSDAIRVEANDLMPSGSMGGEEVKAETIRR